MRNPITSLFKTIYNYAAGHRWTMLLYYSLLIIASAIWLIEPWVIGQIFNVLQVGGETGEVLKQVGFYLVILLILPAAFWAFHGVGRILERKTAFHIAINYDKSALKALFGLPIEWHRNNHSGKNIDKVKRGARAVYGFAEGSFEIIEIFVAIFGSFIVLFFVEFWAGVAAVGVSVVAFANVILFDRILFKKYKKLNAFYNRAASAVHDYVTNIFTVLTMRFESSAVKEYLRRAYKAFPLYVRSSIINEIKWAMVTVIVTLMTVGILGWKIFSTLNAGDVIMVGSLYTIYGYLNRISDHFYEFAWKYSRTVEQDADVASAENIFRDQGRLVSNQQSVISNGWNSIEIQGLHFTYTDEKKVKHQIKDVSLDIPKGARIAFVGESGCGKSTVLGLLRGIYTTDKVDVFVDGEKIPGGLESLHEITTLIPQEPEIFENTIKYNITMGIPVPGKEIDEAVDIARFKKVLKRLPEGLDTDIAEKGVNLSGGENQRLALARGLVAGRGSDILLMDEPTSSVDMKNEAAIFERIFAEYPDKAIIASVHRLNLLPMFDVVVRFKNGEVVQD